MGDLEPCGCVGYIPFANVEEYNDHASTCARCREPVPVTSLTGFLEAVECVVKNWENAAGSRAILPWFRGEPLCHTPLTPGVLRSRAHTKNEHLLLNGFRRRALSLRATGLPERDDTAGWICLAQHFALPTRLLDWSESACAALWFALDPAPRDSRRDRHEETWRTLWMLDPHGLNNLTLPAGLTGLNEEFPPPWHPGWSRRRRPGGVESRLIQYPVTDSSGHARFFLKNPVAENIGRAWEGTGVRGTPLPAAFPGLRFDVRLQAQRACFTVHGSDERPLCSQLEQRESTLLLHKWAIPMSQRDTILRQLRRAGITRSTLFPDLGNTALELAAELGTGNRAKKAQDSTRHEGPQPTPGITAT